MAVRSRWGARLAACHLRRRLSKAVAGFQRGTRLEDGQAEGCYS